MFGVSVIVAILAVTRFVFGGGFASVAAAVLSAVLGSLWYLLPLYRRIAEADAAPEQQ